MWGGGLSGEKIKGVDYGESYIKRGLSKCSPSLMHEKTKVVRGGLEDECGGIVVDFFKNKR